MLFSNLLNGHFRTTRFESNNITNFKFCHSGKEVNTMQQQLEPGNIVHLNSGSPDLKVVSVDGDSLTVVWEQALTLPISCVQIAQ